MVVEQQRVNGSSKYSWKMQFEYFYLSTDL